MGFFSWKTGDTKKSIANAYSERDTFPVYVLLPGGGYIEETNYEGYGKFRDKDIHALLANWNEPEKCTGDEEHDRTIGIELDKKTNWGKNPEAIKYPIKIVEDKTMSYEDAEASVTCENQGFFYDF